MSTLSRCAMRGLAVGVVLSLPVPVLVVLLALVPGLRSGYPLALLPLLAVGPVAIRGSRAWEALGAAAAAGVVSAVLVAGSLAFGSQALGVSVWALTDAATAPPMPPLPRLSILPAAVMTWAQQNILFLQPFVAVALGLLALLARSAVSLVAGGWSGGEPRSLSLRLMLAGGGVAALVCLAGWSGFASLEELHIRNHTVRLHAEWAHHLAEIEAALDAEQRAVALGRDGAAAARSVSRTLSRLADTSPYPGIVMSEDRVREVRDRYQPSLSLLAAAYAAQRARPASAEPVRATYAALHVLRAEVEGGLREITAANDVLYHRRLITLLLETGAAAVAMLWFGMWARGEVVAPLRRTVAHLSRVAGGDYTAVAPRGGAPEFRQLAASADALAADLVRLRDFEGAAQAAAEVKFDHEQVLARAGTALVAAADRDKIF